MFYFFFSSRRRHTRLQGDWSSDVCSSDIWAPRKPPAAAPKRPERTGWHRLLPTWRMALGGFLIAALLVVGGFFLGYRSEERRVGKVCSSERYPHKSKPSDGVPMIIKGYRT